MRVSVSHLDMYRSWKDDEEYPLEVLVSQFKGEEATEPMLRGRAFAKAMERAQLGESDALECDGFTFVFEGEFSIESVPRREVSRIKTYDGVEVSCRCDRVIGSMVIDDKTTSNFDAENYMEKFQWRYYLDVFEADKFVWKIWECKEDTKNPRVWRVTNQHDLVQWRYPGMEKDCLDLAREFGEFARKWMPGYPYPRNYHSSTVTTTPEAPKPQPPVMALVRKANNLFAVGWEKGILLVQFTNGGDYRFGNGENPVPEEVKDKILRSPYPDKLFTQLVPKGKYPSERVF
jgi:hypothetical protein